MSYWVLLFKFVIITFVLLNLNKKSKKSYFFICMVKFDDNFKEPRL